MRNLTAKPERTYALVVGVGEYQEQGWNVSSPAPDAAKFAHWLVKRGVPTANIRLCLSPSVAVVADLVIHPATGESISRLITEDLAPKTGDLLYIFWAGHGVIDGERERRLFCSDTSKKNWDNLDFNSLLLFLSSDLVQIRHQIIIVDACANYLLESQGRPTNLKGRSLSSGRPRVDSQQFVLLASRAGEKAKVNSQEETGYFSQAVRVALKESPSAQWPPDMVEVAQKVKERLADLNKGQIPTYYYYQGWDGDRHSEYLKAKLTPQNLPRSGVVKFVGREGVMTTLHQQLQQTERVAITAVAGMGGVGKTELALQYARYHWEQGTYPGGVCWLGVRGVDVGTQILQFAVQELGLQPPEDWDLAGKINYCWRQWPAGDVLLVLDDVEAYEQIAAYLPPTLPKFKFKVLITTRVQVLAGSIQRLPLDVLDEAAALDLLRSLIGERIDREIEAAKQLCKELGYLPLGLELVGRYLQRKQDVSIAEMLRRLALQHRSLQERSADMTAQRGVEAAFELSWQELDEPAQKLACVLSIFALAPIPWNLVEQCLPDEEAEDLEDVRDEFLVNFSLVERIGERTYQLHQLIRQFLHQKITGLTDVDELKRSFCQVMVKVAQAIPDIPTQAQIISSTPAIPHMGEAATVLQDWLSDEDLIWPFVGLGKLYKGQGNYEQALPWDTQCLEVTRNRLGESHPDVANSLNNLALLYYFQGRYTDTEPLYLQALDLYKRLLVGESHPDVALSLNNLAELYRSQGRYTEAEPLYLQALDLIKRLLGESHPNVASSLNNLAELYRAQGRYTDAESLFLQALDLRKRLLGDSHPLVATSLNNLALLYYSQGRYTEAEPLYLQALELYKRLLGDSHPSVAQSLNNLATLYHSQGRYTEAERFYLQALELYKRLLGDSHPSVAQSLNNLALLYTNQGRYTEAEPLYLQALDLCKRLLGDSHPSVALSVNNLAELYRSQGRYTEAEPLYLQALDLFKRLLGDSHPDVAGSLNNLAHLYYSQGRYTDAEPLHLQALELKKRLLGDSHPDFALSLNNLALLYYSQGRYTDAEPLYLQALAILEQQLGANHPHTITCRNNLQYLRNSRSNWFNKIIRRWRNL
jgi:tetratricopeptide (TPR) repeat protein